MSQKYKFLAMVFGAILTLPCLAQTGIGIQFTNKVITFTNLQGILYQDAILTRADASGIIFKTNGEYAKVAFTNLSTKTLEMLGVGAEYLGRAKSLESQSAESAKRSKEILADEQAHLERPENLTALIIDEVLTGRSNPYYGNVWQCRARQNGQSLVVWVARLPSSVPEYLNQIWNLEQQVAILESMASGEYDRAKQAGRKADAVKASPRSVSDDPTMDWALYLAHDSEVQTAANEAKYAAESAAERKADLDSATAQLFALRKGQEKATTIRALQSAFTQLGSRIFVWSPIQQEDSPSVNARKSK